MVYPLDYSRVFLNDELSWKIVEIIEIHIIEYASGFFKGEFSLCLKLMKHAVRSPRVQTPFNKKRFCLCYKLHYLQLTWIGYNNPDRNAEYFRWGKVLR